MFVLRRLVKGLQSVNEYFNLGNFLKIVSIEFQAPPIYSKINIFLLKLLAAFFSRALTSKHQVFCGDSILPTRKVSGIDPRSSTETKAGAAKVWLRVDP